MNLFEMAKNSGIRYYLCPEKTRELHCTDDQLLAFAEAVRMEEREACAVVCEAMIDPVSEAWRDKRPDEAAEFDAADAVKQACADAIRNRSNALGLK